MKIMKTQYGSGVLVFSLFFMFVCFCVYTPAAFSAAPNIAGLKQNVANAQKALNNARQNLNKAKTKLNKTTTDLNKAVRAKTIDQKAVADAQKAVNTDQANRNNLNQPANPYRKSVADAVAKRDNLKKEYDKKIGEMEKAKADKKQCENNKNIYKNELTRAEKTTKEKQTLYDNCYKIWQELNGKAQSEHVKLGNMQLKPFAKEWEWKNQQKAWKAAREKAEKYKLNFLAPASAELAKCKAAQTQIKKNIENEGIKINKCNTIINACKKSSDLIKSQLDNAQRIAQNALNALNQAVKLADNKLSSAQTALTSAKNKLKASETNAANLNNELSNLKTNINNLNNAVNNSQTAFNQAQAELSKALEP